MNKTETFLAKQQRKQANLRNKYIQIHTEENNRRKKQTKKTKTYEGYIFGQTTKETKEKTSKGYILWQTNKETKTNKTNKQTKETNYKNTQRIFLGKTKDLLLKLKSVSTVSYEATQFKVLANILLSSAAAAGCQKTRSN